MIDIPKPTNEILNYWIADYNRCHDIKVSPELMLQAYLFDCAFIIGSFPDEEMETIRGSYFDNKDNFAKHLTTVVRQGLSNAISYIITGLRSPQYGDNNEFFKEHKKRIKSYELE